MQLKLALALALALAAPQAPPSYDWRLTPAGWGPVRIGMTRPQVEKALRVPLEGEAFDNEGNCAELYSSRDKLTGLYFMFQDGRLSRISAVDKAAPKTPRGLGLGATADEVRKAYGSKLQSEPHNYDGEPAEYLTFWLKPKARGVRFETDVQRKVRTIHAGDDSIQLIEGCA